VLTENKDEVIGNRARKDLKASKTPYHAVTVNAALNYKARMAIMKSAVQSWRLGWWD